MKKNNISVSDKKRQLSIAFVIYLGYTGIIACANILMKKSAITGDEMYENIGGILFGFIAIPVFSIILPLLLAKKWHLHHSFWPKDKPWTAVAAVLIIYSYFGFREPISAVLTSGVSLSDFLIHLLSTSFFHIPYYPLFLVFLFPIFRKNFGVFWGIGLTALTFACYHFSQFYAFPAGLTLRIQAFLVAEFCIILILYLWGQSIILLALAHTINGAFDTAANGLFSPEVDFVLFIAIIVTGLTLAYMIWDEIKAGKKEFQRDWWMHVTIQK